MILYNVTVKIDPSAHEAWVEWMRKTHIPDVMRTGYFSAYRMVRVLGQDDSDGATYSIQYSCPDMATMQRYAAQAAPALQEDAKKLFDGKFVAFRTLLELVEEGSL